MKWNKLKDIDNFKKKVIEQIEWEEAFIKEISLLSPSYLDGNGIVAHDFLPCLKVFLAAPNSEFPCIELLFLEVNKISFSFDICEQLIIEEEYGKICFSFTDKNERATCAKVYFREPGIENLGYGAKYSFENIFDKSGMPII